MYSIGYLAQAVKELVLMRKSSPQTFRKIEKLVQELAEHPYTGTGHPHQVRYFDDVWSRKIDKKNRLRYMVNDETVLVFVMFTYKPWKRCTNS